MASDQRDKDGSEEARCMPCDGRGTVISNLGGTAQEVPCPWCGGTGERVQGIDAQARFNAQREQEAAGSAEGAGEPSGGNGTAASATAVQPSTHD